MIGVRIIQFLLSEDELTDLAVSKFTQHLGIDGEKYVPEIKVQERDECILQYHVVTMKS